MKRLLTLVIALVGLATVAHADIFQTVCSNVDCLNNFTVKTGYSFALKQEGTGGFTDLKQSWYVSPAPGFNFLQNNLNQTPNFDANVLFKFGQLLSDKVPSIHTLVNSDPFVQGMMKYAIVGESGAYDQNTGKWYDMTWIGATVKF